MYTGADPEFTHKQNINNTGEILQWIVYAPHIVIFTKTIGVYGA